MHPIGCKYNMKTLLSTKLKSLRKEYGLTQEDLALKCGVGLNCKPPVAHVLETRA